MENHKRLLALLLSLALCIAWPSFAFAEETSPAQSPTSEILNVTHINALTGEITQKQEVFESSGNSSGSAPGYYPNGNEFSISPFGIVGPKNDMIPVVNCKMGPAQFVTALEVKTPNGKTYVGTGTLVAPGVVLTCAHVIWDVKYGGNCYATSVIVTPGKQGRDDTVGATTVSIEAHEYEISSNFLMGNKKDDWALLFLNQTGGGYSGISYNTNYNSFLYKGALAYGYPAKHWPEYQGGPTVPGTPWTMYQSSGYIRFASADTFKGDWDMVGGFSGGPLMQAKDGGYYVIGINRDGDDGMDWQSYPTAYSGARPMDEVLFNKIMSYR